MTMSRVSTSPLSSTHSYRVPCVPRLCMPWILLGSTTRCVASAHVSTHTFICPARQQSLHKTCFRCATCQSVLKTSGYGAMNDKFYCMVCLHVRVCVSTEDGCSMSCLGALRANVQIICLLRFVARVVSWHKYPYNIAHDIQAQDFVSSLLCPEKCVSNTLVFHGDLCASA
jgi:hypothetical protein